MKTTKKNIIFIVLIVIFAAVFIFSVYNVVVKLNDYKKADTLYSGIREQYVAPVEPEPQPEEGEPPETAPIAVDFEGLLSQNGEVIGWIYSEDTPINYPVVQADDNDKYLKRGLNGKYLGSGTLFADYRNSAVGEDTNFIIYGHHMKNGSMFASILKYKDQSYYDTHQKLYYLTLDGSYRLDPIAGAVVGDSNTVYMLPIDCDSFFDYVQTLVAKSGFKTAVEYSSEDKFMTLSTCSYAYDDARYVLVCKLTPLEQ